MYPELLRIGDFVISSFGVMVALGFLSAYYFSSLEFRRRGLDENLLGNVFIAAMVGGLIGAKILYVYENVPLADLLANPGAYLLSRGGLTFYGGFFLAALLVWIIAARSKVSYWTIGDCLAPSLALAHSIGRIGCLLVGDDYGVPSDVPWAMAFPNGIPPTTETVHPTQIYEAALLGAIFVYLWKIRERKMSVGWLFALFLILAGLERFSIEFLRATTPSAIPGLSVAQVMALILIIFGVVKIAQLRKKPTTGKRSGR
ncbi:MAG: prolipoprotein diacylglyceryl transferase [Deltaproteobacteria bacterium]